VAGISLPPNWPADPDFGGTFDSCLNAKKAGLWLKERGPGDKVVMDCGSAIPCYARAEYLYLPYSAPAVALILLCYIHLMLSTQYDQII
jgi:hypothetical protein